MNSFTKIIKKATGRRLWTDVLTEDFDAPTIDLGVDSIIRLWNEFKFNQRSGRDTSALKEEILKLTTSILNPQKSKSVAEQLREPSGIVDHDDSDWGLD